MADFCSQCSVRLFAEDFYDTADITSQEAFEKGRACHALCEECGPIQVDPAGRCLGGCRLDHDCPHCCSDEGYECAFHAFKEEDDLCLPARTTNAKRQSARG
jgi:hypothetical protein